MESDGEIQKDLFELIIYYDTSPARDLFPE